MKIAHQKDDVKRVLEAELASEWRVIMCRARLRPAERDFGEASRLDPLKPQFVN